MYEHCRISYYLCLYSTIGGFMYIRDKLDREKTERKIRKELWKRLSVCELLLKEYDNTISIDGNYIFANKEKMKRLRLTITDILKDIEAKAREFNL